MLIIVAIFVLFVMLVIRPQDDFRKNKREPTDVELIEMIKTDIVGTLKGLSEENWDCVAEGMPFVIPIQRTFLLEKLNSANEHDNFLTREAADDLNQLFWFTVGFHSEIQEEESVHFLSVEVEPDEDNEELDFEDVPIPKPTEAIASEPPKVFMTMAAGAGKR